MLMVASMKLVRDIERILVTRFVVGGIEQIFGGFTTSDESFCEFEGNRIEWDE